jgi:hypothetical protein
MQEKLKKFLSDQESGAKIAGYAVLVGMFSGLLSFAGLDWFDWLVYASWSVAVFGVALHFVKNWREIFHIGR